MLLLKFRPLLFRTLLICAFGLTCCLRAWQAQVEPSRPHGLFTARQILDRSTPLCRLFAPQTGKLHLTAQILSSDSARWEVEGTDDAGDHLAYVVWDAATGDLLTLSGQPSSRVGSLRPLDHREAAQTAWYWLCTVGIAGPDQRWRLTRAPERWGRVVSCRWHTADRTAFISFDAYSGALQYIECRRLPS